jgi:hypothetical protein
MAPAGPEDTDFVTSFIGGWTSCLPAPYRGGGESIRLFLYRAAREKNFGKIFGFCAKFDLGFRLVI